MHPASTNHATTWLINALNTAAVSHQESVHAFIMPCHPAVFLYIYYIMHLCVTHSKEKVWVGMAPNGGEL